MEIKPIPRNLGYGISTNFYDKNWARLYKHEFKYGFHNYHYTPENYAWPIVINQTRINNEKIIGGFYWDTEHSLSNENLKHLIILNALSKMAPATTILCLLKLKFESINNLSIFQDICKSLKFKPEIHLTPEIDLNSFETNTVFTDMDYIDIFYKKHNPTNLIIESKQIISHRILDYKEFIPLGDVISNKDLMEYKKNFNIKNTQDFWNILILNILKTKIKDICFFDKNWTKFNTEISETYYNYIRFNTILSDLIHQKNESNIYKSNYFKNTDYKYLYISSYFQYYLQKSIRLFSPHPLVGYTFDLINMTKNTYLNNKIINTRKPFLHALAILNNTIKLCFSSLGIMV